MKRGLLMSLLAFTYSIQALHAQPTPVVTMAVTLPDGRTTEVSAPESGVARVTLTDSTEIGLRPTILDSKPWNRVVITFFRLPTTSHASEEIGSVEARTGGPAVQAKISPALKVAVKAVSDSGRALT